MQKKIFTAFNTWKHLGKLGFRYVGKQNVLQPVMIWFMLPLLDLSNSYIWDRVDTGTEWKVDCGMMIPMVVDDISQ